MRRLRGGIVSSAALALILVVNGVLSVDGMSTSASATPSGAPGVEMVGQLGGSSYAVTAQGDYAFLGDGPRLAVVDVSNPAHPNLVSETPWVPGVVSDVVLVGTHVYVAAEEAGLRVYDVSTPSLPVAVGLFDTPGFARGITVAGDYAYVSDVATYALGAVDSLFIIDISDPATPMLAGVHETEGEASDVAVQGDYAYVATGGRGVSVVDISNPAAPFEVGFYDAPEYARALTVSGDYAYLANGYGGLLIVDISNPAAPSEAGFCDTPAFARHVALSLPYAIIADGYGGLRIVDVSQPTAPFEVGSYNPAQYLSAVAVIGTYAYAADGYGGLLSVDISNPAIPVEVGAYDTPGIARSVALGGEHLFVADKNSGLRIVDVSNPAAPEEASFFDTPGGASGVDVVPPYAYVADGGRGLRVVDISNPANPVEVGDCDTPGVAVAVHVVLPYAYIADGEEGLRIVDVSNPAAPVEVGYCQIPGNSQGVVVSGTRAYVSAVNQGLRIVDVSNPAAPFEAGFYNEPPYGFYGVAVEGDLAYVGDGYGGIDGHVRILDVSDPSAPVEVGIHTTERVVRGVTVVGDRVYAADWRGGLLILDVSDPGAPAEILFYETLGDAWGLLYEGDPMGSSSETSEGPENASADGYVYLAGGDGGLVVVRLWGASPAEEFSLTDAPLSFWGEEEGDWAGYSVSPAGDVNNDGFADILVGAPLAGEKNQAPIPKGPGKAYLILGRPRTAWPADHMSLADVDAVFVGCDFKGGMTGRQNYTAGDVNGDGYDDFLISGWKCGPELHGLTFLYLGRENIDWGYDYPAEQADASFLGESPNDHSAYYVSTVGDVNGDGYDDFVTTAPHNDEMGEDGGQVYLILGRPEADWGLSYPLSQADASFLAEAADDRAGRSASGVGDVNGDGYDDFMIGAIFNDEPGLDAGQAYLILGREAADWGMDYPLSQADASFLAEAAEDEIGRRVSGAGDVNGDGYSDFLLAASRNDQAGIEAGKAYLFLGRPAADWGMDFPVVLADASFLGEAPGDQAGRRVSDTGDVNHDGYDDFLIGAPHNQRGGLEAGTTYLLYGSPTANWGCDFPLSQADVAYVGEALFDRSGYDVAPAGDMDGDGTEDFLIGAWSASEAGELAGQAYVLLSAATPEALQFTPDAPQGYVGEWHSFMTEFRDENGWEDIARVQMVLGRTLNDAQGLTVMYRPAENGLYLKNATGPGWLGPCAPGDATKLLNGVTQLDCASTVASNDGGEGLQVTWQARWVLQVGGPRELDAHLRAVDGSRNDSGFGVYGTWTLLPGTDGG